MSPLSHISYTLSDNDLVMDPLSKLYVLRVKDLPLEQKPREKLLQSGSHSLSTAELMAVLLGVGTKREEVLVMAQRIVKEYGEKTMINETNPQHLASALDIPLIKACQIVACFELGRRFFEKRAGRATYIRTAAQAYQYVKDMGELKKEHLRGLYLNSRYQIVHDETISVGTVTSSIIHPREVFRPAIEHIAVAVIIAHNHPSGNLKPTEDDIAATHQLVKAGRVIGIDVLDHLIITKNRFMSIMENIGNASSNLYS